MAAVYSRASWRARSVGLGLLDRVGLDDEGPAQAGHAGADAGPVQAPHHEGPGAAGERAGVLDRGDGAHPAEEPVDAGHEQQAAVGGGVGRGRGLVGLDREGHHHPGQDHAGRQREDRQGQVLDVGHGWYQLS